MNEKPVAKMTDQELEKIVKASGGRRVSAEEIEERERQFENLQYQRRREAWRPIERYKEEPTKYRRKAAIQAIGRVSALASSDNRIEVVLVFTAGVGPEIFWPVFMGHWNRCDATWRYRFRLRDALEGASIPATKFYSRSQREFFNTLPPLVQVFRGCSRLRVRAISWTTDRSVAESFARGHRGLWTREPVIASAVIPKDKIYFVSGGGKEREIVLQPRHLRILVVEQYEHPWEIKRAMAEVGDGMRG